MVSKAGKTQVASNSIDIWQYEQILWQKSPCKACRTISTFVRDSCWLYTQIQFDNNISIIISPCLKKSRKDIWQQWDYY